MMRKMIMMLSLMLGALLAFTACKNDKNDPKPSEDSSYLVGKTFVNGQKPLLDNANYDYSQLSFSAGATGRWTRAYYVRGENAEGRGEAAVSVSYSYSKPQLTIRVTTPGKALSLVNGQYRIVDVAPAEPKALSFVVDETKGTITGLGEAADYVLTLQPSR